LTEPADYKNPLVVACIPAYDEEKTIGGVVVRTKGYVNRVLVCDDGSRDLTAAIAGGGCGCGWVEPPSVGLRGLNRQVYM